MCCVERVVVEVEVEVEVEVMRVTRTGKKVMKKVFMLW